MVPVDDDIHVVARTWFAERHFFWTCRVYKTVEQVSKTEAIYSLWVSGSCLLKSVLTKEDLSQNHKQEGRAERCRSSPTIPRKTACIAAPGSRAGLLLFSPHALSLLLLPLIS